MSTLKQRIADVIADAGGVDPMSEATGIGPRSLYDYMSGKSSPTPKRLRAFCDAAGITTAWLLTGRGPKHPHTAEQVAPEYREVSERNCVYFPLGDNRGMVSPAIPAPKVEDDVDVLAISGRWILDELRAKPSDLVVAHVPGDSMSPFLRPGDVVLLDSSDVRVEREGVYFIRMDGTVIVKQLQRLPGGVIKVSSRNPEYEPFTVKMDAVGAAGEFSVMGRVACALVRF